MRHRGQEECGKAELAGCKAFNPHPMGGISWDKDNHMQSQPRTLVWEYSAMNSRIVRIFCSFSFPSCLPQIPRASEPHLLLLSASPTPVLGLTHPCFGPTHPCSPPALLQHLVLVVPSRDQALEKNVQEETPPIHPNPWRGTWLSQTG